MKSLLLAASAYAVIAASPAVAQDAPSASIVDDQGQETSSSRPGQGAAPAEPPEIIVTARGQTERLRDVPLAITALSNEQLAQQNVSTVRDLARVTPSLTISSPNTDPFSPVVSMRGQVQNDITLLALDTSVAFYVDDFYISRPNALIAYGTFDLQRVEVARGPQGTLFGRNATGGNIRYITQQPTGEFEGYVRGQLGNFDHREIEGAINLPIIGDRLAIRVAGLSVYDNGYGRSLAPTNTSRYGDANNFASRATVLAQPIDAVRLTFSWNHFDGESGNQVATLISAAPSLAAMFPTETATALGLRYDSLSAFDHFADATNDLYTAAIEIDLADNIQFRAIYGRMDIVIDQQFDLVPLGPVGTPIRTHVESSQDSVEARFSGRFFDDRLNIQAGVYYLDESGSTDLLLYTPVVGLGAGSNLIVRPINTAANESRAIFAQGTFAITPQLRLTLGGRYTDERRIGTSSQLTTIRALGVTRCGLDTTSAAGRALLAGDCIYQGIKDDDYFSYLASLDWRLSAGHLLYVKTARSYRAGGFNPRGTGPETFAPFQPESVTEYEAGFRGRFFDRLSVNLIAFLDQRRNGQQTTQVLSPQTGQAITLIGNVVNIDIFGQELQAVLDITDFLTVDANYTHLNQRLQLTPQQIVNVGVTAHGRVGPGELTARVSYYWQSDFDPVPPGCGRAADFRLCPTYVASLHNVESYGLVNGRISYRLDNPNIEFAIFGRNLTDELYYNFRYDARSSGGSVGYPGTPRTYGVEARFSF